MVAVATPQRQVRSSSRVLVVDDDSAMTEMLKVALTHRDFNVTTAATHANACAMLDNEDFDVVLTDLNMGGRTGATSGLALVRHVLESRPGLPVILMTAYGNMETAIAAIRAGAYDFLPKPFEIDHLALTLDRAVKQARLEDEVRRLRRAVQQTHTVGRSESSSNASDRIVGESAKMKELFRVLDRVSEADAPVLIVGESGTGKELVARALHDRSQRAPKPFVAINCAALPEALLESELFGHTKGAFTDARSPKTGLFVAASGGTLFLDEIGEMPLGLQPKLLRALQERVVRPIGSTTEVPFDTRIVAATNRDLEVMVEDRRFREDLLFRINVFQISLPALRDRGSDVLLLAHRFLERIAARVGKPVTALSAEVCARFLAYPWPGNVRELQNSIERAVALTSTDRIEIGDLTEKIARYEPKAHVVIASDDPTELISLEDLERRYVVRVLECVGGNKSAAARILQIERKTLYRMMERWGPGSNAKAQRIATALKVVRETS